MASTFVPSAVLGALCPPSNWAPAPQDTCAFPSRAFVASAAKPGGSWGAVLDGSDASTAVSAKKPPSR